MRLNKGVMLGLLFAIPFAGFADKVTNVTWKSSLSLGATVKSGNTDKSLYTMNLKGNRTAPKSDWINSLYGEYGETENKTTGEDEQTEGQLRGQSEYRYKFTGERLFGGIFSEAYQDDLKQIYFRIKVGPNIGYYWVKRETMKFDTSLGINYVYQKTAKEEGDHAEYRAAANYLWEFTEHSSYYFNIEYNANVEEVDDGNGLLVTGLKSRLKENLSMFFEVRDEYDNIPDGDGVEHNDVTLLAGLTYDFM